MPLMVGSGKVAENGILIRTGEAIFDNDPEKYIGESHEHSGHHH